MDRIYEAYMGSMGEAFAEKTQKRIHWICSKVQGNNILDVGCSQGITAILLAREGFQVTGLDISDETIERAWQYLSEETEEVQKRVAFYQADFGCYSATEHYDTIIMGEVLEHLLHPQIFISNAAKLLNDNGRFIITVPFGINDDPDHKQTFYYFALIHLLEQYFQISETVFFGKWIGFVAEKNNEAKLRSLYGYEECLQVEQAFYAVERDHINQYASLAEKSQEYQRQILEKLKNTETNYQTAKQWLNNKNTALEQANTRNAELINSLAQEKKSTTQRVALLQEENAKLKETVQQIRKILSDSEDLMEDEEEFLMSLQKEVHSLKQQLHKAKWKASRYDALHKRLTGSWYGKIVLKGYRVLKKIKALVKK